MEPNQITPIKKSNSPLMILMSLMILILFIIITVLGIQIFLFNKQLNNTTNEVKKISNQLNSVKEANSKQVESNQEFQSKLNSISSNSTSKSISDTNINNFADLTKSIVKIYNISRSSTSSGTGTIIDKEGHILTNKHVIEESSSYYSSASSVIAICITNNPDEKPKCEYTAEIINIGTGELDLALLKIDKKLKYSGGKFQTSSLQKEDLALLKPKNIISEFNTNPQLGSQINVVGYPGAGGDSISLTQGIYSGSIDELFFKTDAKVNSGNSGGAAFDSSNKFLGVPTAVSGGQGNIGYIIKAQQVINFIKESITN
jgi:S1-C subfamily serine protease